MNLLKIISVVHSPTLYPSNMKMCLYPQQRETLAETKSSLFLLQNLLALYYYKEFYTVKLVL